jgi:tetratricopeptide (TPR) repeat protein
MKIESRFSTRLALTAALLIIGAVSIQSAAFEFVYDDFGQIVYNPRVQSWKLAWGNFTSHVWAHTGDVALYYRPAFMIWLTANHSLFGLDPLFWHLSAIALYLASCLLLCFFACRLTESRGIAVIAVLLFGLHPAHVETVAWVSGATESLLGVMLLGSLLCYWKHQDSGRPRMSGWLVASLILGFLAVLTKETALVLPGLIICYEWIFHGGQTSRKARCWSAARAAAPYVLISIVFLVMRALALKRLAPPRTSSGLLSVLLAWPQVIAFYLGHILVPFRLSVFYHPLAVEHPEMRNFILPLLIVSAMAAALYYGSRCSQTFAFLSLWCAIMLVPMLNVTLWSNLESVHDRYLFLPSAAYCLMMAMAMARLWEVHRTYMITALLLITAGYIYVTENEIQYWRNDYELAQHGVTISPGHPIAAQLLGNTYIRQGRTADAIPWLVESLKANPRSARTLTDLSYCYSERNALPLAEESITTAISLKRSDPRAHLVLGMIRLKQNRLAEAEAVLRRGIQLQNKLTPGNEELFHYHLGDVLYAKGDPEGAIREYQLELRNDPAADPAVVPARERISQIEHALHQP